MCVVLKTLVITVSACYMCKTSLTRNPAVKNMKKLGLGIFLFFVAIAMNSVVASAAKNQPNDKVLNMLTKLAYSQVPAKIKDRKTGKMIDLNKKNPKSIVIPVDDARRVIRVGYISGKAQLCGEEAYQIALYQSMMKAETKSGKWSPAQLVYINKLHLMTVMMTTGQIAVKQGELTDSERDAAKKEVTAALKKKITKKKNCAAKEIKEIKTIIEKFVDDNKKS